MEDFIGKVVMPGDVIFDLDNLSPNDKLVFGPGLRRENEKIFAMKCGILKRTSSKIYYIDNHQKRVCMFSLSYAPLLLILNFLF